VTQPENSGEPQQPSLAHWIASTLTAHPEWIVVREGSRETSAAEVWQRAQALGAALRASGVRRGDHVGVFVEPTDLLPIAVTAILTIGAVYVPLDPSFPESRLAIIRDDAQVSALVASERWREAAQPWQCPIVDPFALEPAVVNAEVWQELGPADAAYVIFTSGSTGRPKGVVVEHGSIVGLLADLIEQRNLEPGMGIATTWSSNFDGSLPALLLPLVHGLTSLCLPPGMTRDPRGLATLLATHDARILETSPTMLQMLLESQWPGKENLELWMGGERMSASVIAAMASRVSALINFYGPTEATVEVTSAVLSPSDSDSPIGWPMAGARLFVVDENDIPVAPGVVGELLIGGPVLARGYLGDNERTAEKFPLLTVDGVPERVYRTGDLVRQRDDGALLFVGRRDEQVKIRGYRVELSDIEAALTGSSLIDDAVVVLHEGAGEPQLVAYVLADDHVDLSPLHERAVATLPAYMVPQRIVPLAAYPLTPVGKIDRRALAALPVAVEPHVARDVVPPRTPVEQVVHDAFARALDRDAATLGIDDDFFDMGGTSLRCARLFFDLEERFDIDLPITTVMRAATVRTLATVIAGPTEAPETLPVDASWADRVADVWATALGHHDFGPSDDVATEATMATCERVVALLHERYGATVATSTVTQFPTVAQLARHLDGGATDASVVVLHAGGTRPPFFCIAGAGGLALAFAPLSRALGPDQPCYGLQARGIEHRALPHYTAAAAARYYATQIQRIQPSGPYYVGGHSQGGVEALYVAQELTRRGERVALLVILDSIVSAAMLPVSVANSTAAPSAPGMPSRPRLLTLLRLPFRGLVQFKGVTQFEMFYYWGLVQLRFARRLSQWNGPTFLAVSELRRTAIEGAWRYLVTGPLEVVAIPGDHNAMLRGPSAALLGSYLATALAEADEVSGP